MRIDKDEKRTMVLKVAWKLFSEMDYEDVYLKDIARTVNLNKSQLQNIFSKKSDIMSAIIEEIIDLSNRYIEEKISENVSVFNKLALFTAFFWKMTSETRKMDRVMMNITKNTDLRTILIDYTFQWHQDMKYDGSQELNSPLLKPALVFAISGGLELYERRDSINVDIRFISRIISEVFMTMLGCSRKKIKEAKDYTDQLIHELDSNDFYAFCLESSDIIS